MTKQPFFDALTNANGIDTTAKPALKSDPVIRRHFHNPW